MQVQKQINLQRKTHKKRASHSLNIDTTAMEESNGGMSPSPDVLAQEEAFALFMGGRHGSFEDSAVSAQQTQGHARGDTVKIIHDSHSGNISAPLKKPRDILCICLMQLNVLYL